MQVFIVLIFVLAATPVAAAQPRGTTAALTPVANAPLVEVAPGSMVGVIMRVVVDEAGKPIDAQVFRTLPVGPGQLRQGAVELPNGYIAAVRAKLLALHFRPAAETYRYFVYDPERPDRIDLGPDPATQDGASRPAG